MKNWQKIFLSISVLTISAGSFWHLSDIFGLYFSYPTNILIETNFHTDERDLPAITFCANVWNMTRNRTTQHIFNDFDLDKIIIEVSLSEYLFHKAEDLKEYSLKQMSESLSLRYYCFSLNLWLKGLKLSLQKLLKVRLNTINSNGSWWIYLHDSMDRPSSYEWNAIELKQKQFYHITYSLTSFHLLGSPYPTNCRHYFPQMEFSSQKDCIRRCRRQLMEKKCGFLSHEVDVMKGEPIARFANAVEDENCGQNEELRQFCGRMCPFDDCIKHFYKPKKRLSQEIDGQYIELLVIIPSEPLTSFIHRPQIQTIEFFCYMASVLSIWFGFSFLSLCFWLKILIIKLKEMGSFKQKIKIFSPRLNHRRKRFVPAHINPTVAYI